VTQEAASHDALARPRAPVAPPWRRRLATCGLHHDQLRRQYITRARLLGTLMRHDLLLPTPAIARCSSSMGEASRAAALIAPPGLALQRATRLFAARPAAVAPPAVAAAAYQHFGLTASTGEHSSAQRPGRRSSSRHRHARSSPERALRSEPPSLDLIARRCNTLPALVADTVGRGCRNNLPVIAAAAPVLHHGAVLPRLRLGRPSPSSDRRRPRLAQRIPPAPDVKSHGARCPRVMKACNLDPDYPMRSRHLAYTDQVFTGSISLSTRGSVWMSAKVYGSIGAWRGRSLTMHR
jgi:hypothetical protein